MKDKIYIEVSMITKQAVMEGTLTITIKCIQTIRAIQRGFAQLPRNDKCPCGTIFSLVSLTNPGQPVHI
jgi:hypothetical protein